MKKTICLLASALVLGASRAEAAEIAGREVDPAVLCIAVGIAFLIALLICLKFKSDMKTARIAGDADEYLQSDSVSFYDREDTYLNTTVVRQPLPQQKKQD